MQATLLVYLCQAMSSMCVQPCSSSLQLLQQRTCCNARGREGQHTTRGGGRQRQRCCRRSGSCFQAFKPHKVVHKVDFSRWDCLSKRTRLCCTSVLLLSSCQAPKPGRGCTCVSKSAIVSVYQHLEVFHTPMQAGQGPGRARQAASCKKLQKGPHTALRRAETI